MTDSLIHIRSQSETDTAEDQKQKIMGYNRYNSIKSYSALTLVTSGVNLLCRAKRNIKVAEEIR